MENLTSLLLAASVSMNGRRLAQAARGQLTLGHLAGRAYSMDLRLRRISAARSLTSGSDVKIMRLCFVFTEKGGTSMLSRCLIRLTIVYDDHLQVSKYTCNTRCIKGVL